MWHMWQLWRAVNRVQKVPCLVRGCFCYHYSIEGVGDYCWGWAFWLPPVCVQQCTYYRHSYGNATFYCTHLCKIPPPLPLRSLFWAISFLSICIHTSTQLQPTFIPPFFMWIQLVKTISESLTGENCSKLTSRSSPKEIGYFYLNQTWTSGACLFKKKYDTFFKEFGICPVIIV